MLADFIFGSIIDGVYQIVPTKQSYALTKCKEDIIILGSSRAESGIIPSIISDSTKMSCYNFSVGGQNIYYYYGILNAILTHHTPKVVLIDITAIDYNSMPGWNKEKVSVLSPLYSHVDSVKELLDSVDYLNRIRFQSHSYQYNSTLFTLLSANDVQKNHLNDFINGYIPILKKYNKKISICGENNFQIDYDKVKYIKKIGKICHDKKILLILTMSPQFLIMDNKDFNIAQFESYLLNDGFIILNYSQDKNLINHMSLFADPAHMNNDGAEKYTKLLAQRLKSMIIKNTE